jgi:hypothetical protein
MEEHTTPAEQVKLMAVCWLDGVGEEWQRVSAEVFNGSLRARGGRVEAEEFKSGCDMEYFQQFNPPEQSKQSEVDWQAVEASMKGLAGF